MKRSSEYFRLWRLKNKDKSRDYVRWFEFKKLLRVIDGLDYSDKTKLVLITGRGVDERIQELMGQKEEADLFV